jgi:hypothetical protein
MRANIRPSCPIALLIAAVLLVALSASRELWNADFAGGPTIHLTLRHRALPGHDRIGLPPTHHTPDQNLLFDPVLAYSTFLGGANGSSSQGATAFSVDSSGNAYVAGPTGSASFPVTPGVVEPNNANRNLLGFLSKIDPTGKSLLFSTYLDGIYAISAMAVDANGNVYIAGRTGNSQPPLPIPSGTTPFQATPKAIGILKLNNTATAVLNATYLGGSGSLDIVSGLAVDANGNVYVTGLTTSNDFPTQNPLQGSLGASGFSGFVTKFDPSLSTLVYSTYLGQNSSVDGSIRGFRGIAVDTSQNAYVVGNAGTGFPTTSGAFQSSCNSTCTFLAKLDASGSSLLYSTYLGEESEPSGVAVDGLQNSYVVGFSSASFPTPGGSCAGAGGFVAEINAAGSLAFSTCLGGFTNDLALDTSGNIYVVGSGAATLKNPIQASSSGLSTLFIAAINPNTNVLLFSSLIGGVQASESDLINGVGVDSSGNVYAAGIASVNATSFDIPPPFPVFNALQPVPAVGSGFCINCASADAFILKIAPANAAAAALSPALLTFPVQQVGTASTAQTVTIIDMGSAPLTVSNAAVTGDFSIQDSCGTVSSAGGTCTIQITFTPTATGTRTGTLTIIDSSAGSPHTVQLTGEGGQGSASLSPASLSFSSQQVGTTSSAQTVTLTNTGAIALQLSRVQVTGPFAETNNCGASVGASQSCSISITFTPTAAGAATGALTFTDSAPDSPQTVALTGSGAMGFAMSASTSSATVSAGAIATFNLTATAANGFSGSVNFTCSGAPNASTCKVSPNPLTLTGGGTPANFTVTVATTARSAAQLNAGQGLSASAQPDGGLGLMAGWLGLPFVLLPLRLGAKRGRRTMLVLIGLVMLSAAGLGCGSSSPSSPSPTGTTGTPAGAYAIIVTATSGTMAQTTTLNLTVN